MNNETLLEQLRCGRELSVNKLFKLIFSLSMPAIMAQVSTIIMEYIDASMVGHLGANGSAAIGLIASTTWLFGGLSHSINTGFMVQVAQAVGAGNNAKARKIVKTGLLISLAVSLVLMNIGLIIKGGLPVWLGGSKEIVLDASMYFMVYALALPIAQITHAASGMLQGSGNMKVPSILHVAMCIMDVFFNMLLIFPARVITIGSFSIHIWGAGLGVMGAALGTALAELVTLCLMLYFLLVRSKELHLGKHPEEQNTESENVLDSLEVKSIIKNAFKIAIPIGLEQIVTCGAQIASTKIVAPLGTVAVAANSLSVTAESLCYMPGYGIASAAITLIGQSVGAGRKELTRKMGLMITGVGMAVMAATGILMFAFAPQMIGLLSPDYAVKCLGATILRIEAFAEPLFAASIVATGVFRGTGDTLIPSTMNFCSMWFVRIPVAFFLAPRMGLKGVWLAMCIELWVRGILFLIKLFNFERDKRIRSRKH